METHVYRRRRCLSCRRKWSTAEIPLDEFEALGAPDLMIARMETLVRGLLDEITLLERLKK